MFLSFISRAAILLPLLLPGISCAAPVSDVSPAAVNDADAELRDLFKRADGDALDDLFHGQVSWTSWTSGDGVKSGKDQDGVPYVQTFIQQILNQTPNPIERNLVYWVGGFTRRDHLDEFTESETRMPNGGKQLGDFFDQDLMDELGIGFGTNLYWRALNRMSKALAACATHGVAHIYMRPVCGRTIFSPPSQSPSDEDEAAGGAATNGEIFHYAELPTLMRNLNVEKIYTFWKPEGSHKFEARLAWDANNPGEYTRTYFDDIAMDAAPIILPAEAGRGPLKRQVSEHGVW